MHRAPQPGTLCFAISLIALGILAFVYRDFAMVWQPVAPWFPSRTALVYVAGFIELACGIGLLFPGSARMAIRILFPFVILWSLLKVPDIVTAPLVEGSWSGLGELTILVSGAWVLFASLTGASHTLAIAGRRFPMAFILFGASLPAIGLSHFVYHGGTYSLIPAWMPYRAAFVYITGAGQIASGLGVLFNILPRVAAWAEVIQIALYTGLIWIPSIFLQHTNYLPEFFTKPDMRLALTASAISWTIGAAALLVAQSIPAKSSVARDA